MGTTDDRIQVDNAHVPVVAMNVLGFDNPQPGGTIRLSGNRGVPVYESARIVRTSKRELEE
jgi:hypothetical protein